MTKGNRKRDEMNKMQRRGRGLGIRGKESEGYQGFARLNAMYAEYMNTYLTDVMHFKSRGQDLLYQRGKEYFCQ